MAPLPERRDPGGIRIEADDRVPEIGKAGAAHKTDVSRADDCYVHDALSPAAGYQQYGSASAPTAARRVRAHGLQDLPHRPEPEFRDQPLQPRFGLVEVAVVPQAAQAAGGEPRLGRIDLPRMQVEDRRAPLLLVDPPDPPARPGVRQQPEVAAAGDRQVQRPEPDRRTRRLDERSAVALEQVRLARRERNAVAIVMDREDARVVREPLLDEDVERPQRSRRDRIARRAVAEHRACPMRLRAAPFARLTSSRNALRVRS